MCRWMQVAACDGGGGGGGAGTGGGGERVGCGVGKEGGRA